MPINILRAKSLSRILEEMSIYILGDELIVGNHSSRLKAAPVFPEFDVNFLEEEINDFANGSGDRKIASEIVLTFVNFLFIILIYLKDFLLL